MLLEHRPEHEAEQERGGLAPEFHQDVAEQAERRDREQIEGIAVDAVDPDRAEGEDRREQYVVRDAQHPHPDADEREIEDDEQQVADPHRHDDAPEQGRLVRGDVWPGAIPG